MGPWFVPVLTEPSSTVPLMFQPNVNGAPDGKFTYSQVRQSLVVPSATTKISGSGSPSVWVTERRGSMAIVPLAGAGVVGGGSVEGGGAVVGGVVVGVASSGGGTGAARPAAITSAARLI